MNEIWTEAEFESIEAHIAAFEAAGENEELMAEFREYLELVVPGTIHDYPLEPIDLD